MTKLVTLAYMHYRNGCRGEKKSIGALELTHSETYFFCGIGGSGMSALAQVLQHRGNQVRGSDRTYDQGLNTRLYEALGSQHIVLHAQDGSGVDAAVDVLVVSSAVEETIPDVKKARLLGVPVKKRADILASLFNASRGIAIGGTSGKTTVTGMVGHILEASGASPTVINGGGILNSSLFPGNAICGESELMAIEADESDGSIALYEPAVGVVTNISLDHKPLEELRGLFGEFCGRSGISIKNLNCLESRHLQSTVSFGVDSPGADYNATVLRPTSSGARFSLNGQDIQLRVAGVHNVSNAAASVAVADQVGVALGYSADALRSFPGIRRRLQVLGEAGGIRVIDDFAHNPEKIRASLQTLKARPGRIIVMFQPTGFAPTRMLKDGLIDAFADELDESDLLMMPEIYYAGGTASRDISSLDLVDAVMNRGIPARYFPERNEIGLHILKEVGSGDRVVVMGARDDTLTEFAQGILEQIERAC